MFKLENVFNISLFKFIVLHGTYLILFPNNNNNNNLFRNYLTWVQFQSYFITTTKTNNNSNNNLRRNVFNICQIKPCFTEEY